MGGAGALSAVRRDGTGFPIEVALVPQAFAEKRTVLCIVRDVSDRRRLEQSLMRQALHDPLTDLPNRRHYQEQLGKAIARAARCDDSLAVLFVDLDNFKHINDRHGHATGDWVLKQVAVACRAACRDGDLFGRLGGEEFAILTCGGDLHTAERIAQQCREQLAQIDTETLGADTPAVTASYGCATTRLSSFAFETLFMHADRAMYRAKAEGRDRVCVHEERPVLVRTPAMA